MTEGGSAPEGREADRPGPRWLGHLRSAENSLVIAVQAGMVLLPITEILLRRFFNVGITGSTGFVQHFTLAVGVLGGALAARQNRLLSLSTLTAFLSDRWKHWTRLLSGSFAMGITAVLAWASWEFVMTLKPDSPELAYGVRAWMFQLLLPLGFAVIVLRLCWHVSAEWKWRGLALLLSAGPVWLLGISSIDPEGLVWPAMIALIVATLLGAPIYTALGGAALILFWGMGRPMTLVPLNHYELVTDPILPSIPLFTLTGYFLAEGGASQRLVRVFQAVVGTLRGGPALVTVLVCAFFTAFTGASGVTILALGGLLLPALLSAHYSEKAALGLLTGAGSLGVLLPPCLPLILYAIIAQRTITSLDLGAGGAGVSINQLFLGAIGPGILLVLLTGAWAVWRAPKAATAGATFSWPETGRAVWEAKWELLLPVGALALILGGLATPVEAAAATALYAFFVQTVVHRDLHLTRDVPRVMAECGALIGGVLLILGVAMGLTAFLIFEDVPTMAVEWIQGSIESKLVFLLLLNVMLLLVGCLMDILSAIIVVVPLIVPVGMAFGVHPVHLGVIFLANLQLGYLTPPVGMNLFLASYRFGKPVPYIIRSIIPIFLVLLVGVLLITYWPALSLALPRWLGLGP